MSIRRTNLPALRPPYDTSSHVSHEYNAIAVGSPRGQEIVSVPFSSDIPGRIDNLEDRVNLQERNTQVG